jgi:predicted lactoylglutathione lyase
MTNLERLKEAGLVPDDYEFDQNEETAIESLSNEEVNALISSKEKLGGDFIQTHVPHGMMF